MCTDSHECVYNIQFNTSRMFSKSGRVERLLTSETVNRKFKLLLILLDAYPKVIKIERVCTMHALLERRLKQ